MMKLSRLSTLMLAAHIVFIASIAASSPLAAQSYYWKRVAAYSNTDLMGHDCSDSLDCMMSAWLGRATFATYIYHSTDGGMSWEKSYIDTAAYVPFRHYPLRLYEVQHPSRNLTLVGADSGIILRSSDGGGSWARHQVADTFNRCDHISMFDDHCGIATFIGQGTPVCITSDGGLNWQRVDVPRPSGPDWDSLPHYIYNAECITPATYLFIISGPRTHAVVRSDDSGAHWTLKYPMLDPPYDTTQLYDLRFSFVDADHGFATLMPATNKRTLLARTDDGGRTWRVVFDGKVGSDPPEIPLSLGFRDTLHGTLGGFYHMFSTSDGGRTWLADSCESFPAAYPEPTFHGVRTGIAHAQMTGEVLLRVPVGTTSVAHERTVIDVWKLASITIDADVIRVQVRSAAPRRITLALFDMAGHEVARVPESFIEAGEHEASLNIDRLPTGRYLLRARSGGEQQSGLVAITH